MLPLTNRTTIVKTASKDLGFLSCGISKAEFLEEEAPRLEQWLKEGKQGKMAYMENHFDKRLDPPLLVPGAKSVISLLFNYYTDAEQRVLQKSLNTLTVPITILLSKTSLNNCFRLFKMTYETSTVGFLSILLQ